ncbi:MAG TPA: EAL domain-containing protein [Acidimicrobiia bacterium]|nr:EAL domain-containing protein [Acidimicrobiia bacterium]
MTSTRPGGAVIPAAAELLGLLSGAAAAFGEPHAALTGALERLLGGPVRAAVAYVPDRAGRLAPEASAPVGAGVAGVGRALETDLSRVAADRRPRILPLEGGPSPVADAVLGDPGVEGLLLAPFWAGPNGWGVLALGFAAPEIDPGWQAFAAVVGALTGQQRAVGHLESQVATLEGLLHAQATVDPLTGLPNQVQFAARLGEAIAGAERDGRMVAVAFLDLDRFRTVNDVLGHIAGDKLLQQVAGRLADRFGHQNVFRMAGDEFVLLREGLGRDDDHARSLDAARTALRRPFVCGGHDLVVTASIGIALYPYDGEDLGTLVRNADCAMFRAKEHGGDTVECYSQGLFEEARRRLSLERSLHRAVGSDEITLDYQPQFDLVSGAVVGFEALARWHHPELGILLPSAFMALAEETGLIVPIGERIMELACRQARQWSSTHPDLRVWVNLSARQFHQGDIPSLVGRCLDVAGLPAGLLGVEVTESLAMRHHAEAAAVLGELGRLGVKTALDDFGTGYSSLAYLSTFSVDALKLDRSFVHRGPAGGNDATIARAVIALAHSLGITVVAEGVETEPQRSFLVGEGCDQAQGFLLARPMAAAAVTRFLDSWHHFGTRPS